MLRVFGKHSAQGASFLQKAIVNSIDACHVPYGGMSQVSRLLGLEVRAGMSSLGGLKGYDERENAQEAVFFKKEDEKLLKDLLKKVRAQAEKHDEHSAKGVRAAERSSLESIVGDKLTEAEKDALLEWKHTHF